MSRCGLGIQAALLATFALPACGAGLDFARCMRERGTMEACSERGPGLRLAE